MTLSEILGYLSLMGFLASWFNCRSEKKIDFANHGQDDLADVIRGALMVSPDQGVITISDLNSEYRVLFRAHNCPEGGCGLEFGFPLVDWSLAHSASLRERLQEQGISFREASEPYGDSVAGLHVDCGRDIEKAAELARFCFFDLYRLESNSRFRTSPSSWPTIDEVVDTNVESKHRHRIYHVKLGMPPVGQSVRLGILTAAFLLCGYPALWLAWFLADQRQPDWQWSIGAIHLAGSHATWILLLIFVAFFEGFARTARYISRYVNPRPKTKFERIYNRTAWSLITYGLPLAVITSWIKF